MGLSSLLTPSLANGPIDSIDGLAIASSLAMGGAVGLVIFWIRRTLLREDLVHGSEWRYDVSRMNELRRLDVTYRLFQPLIIFLGKLNRSAFAVQLPEIQREILAAGLPRYWLPEEYLARGQVLALLLMPAYAAVCLAIFGQGGMLLAVPMMLGTAWLFRRSLTRLARRRLVAIKRRLPFLLDLLTLLMGAGASFLQALKQAVHEFEGHPVAMEFGRVLADINMGKTRVDAFSALRTRLADEEIAGVIGAIIQSEQLGTPIAEIFRSQSDVLQIKRSQRAETLAGEAGVNMLLPGILVMAATVLIILGPFLLNYVYFGFQL